MLVFTARHNTGPRPLFNRNPLHSPYFIDRDDSVNYYILITMTINYKHEHITLCKINYKLTLLLAIEYISNPT